MPSVRRLLLVAALAAAGAWMYAIVGAGTKLFSLLDVLDASSAEPVVADQKPRGPPADRAAATHLEEVRPVTAVAAAGDDLSVQPMPSDDLSPTEIMRLLENEVFLETDPVAADELLRAFHESLDTHD